MLADSGSTLAFKCAFHIAPSLRDREPVGWAIEQLLQLAGWQGLCVTSSQEAGISYSRLAPTGAVTLPCAGADAWAKLTGSKPVTVDGLVVPSAAVVSEGGLQRIDPVLTTYWFLTGQHESTDGVLQKPGVPGKGIAKWGLLDRPTVDHLAEQLRQQLLASGAVGPASPHWPEGKSWCFCLTHDCDRLHRYRPLGYLREVPIEWKSNGPLSAGMKLGRSAVSAIMKLKSKDPYLGSWESWIAFERELGIRSASYVATWNRLDANSSPSDVGYTASRPQLRQFCENMIEGGWEIGLHSSINCWRYDRFDEETDRFTKCFGLSPKGSRSHHWSLNPDAHEQTLVSVAGAGFDYDSSMGMNEVHGFRRGTSCPYHPYDPTNGIRCGLWELPPVMMDDALYKAGDAHEIRRKIFRDRVDTVSRYGGCMTIDWHTDMLWNGHMDGLGMALLDEITLIASDASCWVATPRQIIDWCTDIRWRT